MWRLYPWLLGLILAPLLFGSVTTEGQVVVGILLGGSLLLCAGQSGGWSRPLIKPLWLWMAGALLLLPLLPLPMAWMNLLDASRSVLARNFPVAPGFLPSWIPLQFHRPRPCNGCGTRPGPGVLFLAAATHYAPAPRLLALGIASAVCLLAASDIWYRLTASVPCWGFGNTGAKECFSPTGIILPIGSMLASSFAGWACEGCHLFFTALRRQGGSAERSARYFVSAGRSASRLITAVVVAPRGGLLALLASSRLAASLEETDRSRTR